MRSARCLVVLPLGVAYANKRRFEECLIDYSCIWTNCETLKGENGDWVVLEGNGDEREEFSDRMDEEERRGRPLSKSQ